MLQRMVVGMGAFSGVTIHGDTELAAQSCTLQENLRYVNHLRRILGAQVLFRPSLHMEAAPEPDCCKVQPPAQRGCKCQRWLPHPGSPMQLRAKSLQQLSVFHQLVLDESVDSAKSILQTMSICISSR